VRTEDRTIREDEPGDAPPTERVIFSGRVQGVGFRYTVRKLARRHPVTGFVRNLPDGTVELIVQGKIEAANALLADVALAFEGYIQHYGRKPVESPEKFAHFEIR
jgi:acylphosphatase